MEVKELKESLAVFNPMGLITVAIPSLGSPHELRGIRVVGHLDHPGEVKDDPTHQGALDIVCDHWDEPANDAPALTIGGLSTMIAPYPDPMHVRIAVPVSHESISHRMLDIVMLGHAVGTSAGVQIVCENWDGPYQVIKEIPAAAAARLAAAQ